MRIIPLIFLSISFLLIDCSNTIEASNSQINASNKVEEQNDKSDETVDSIEIKSGNGSVSPPYHYNYTCSIDSNSFVLNYQLGSKTNLFNKLNVSKTSIDFIEGSKSYKLTQKDWYELNAIIEKNKADQSINKAFREPMPGSGISSLSLFYKGEIRYTGQADFTVGEIKSWVEQYILNH